MVIIRDSKLTAEGSDPANLKPSGTRIMDIKDADTHLKTLSGRSQLRLFYYVAERTS